MKNTFIKLLVFSIFGISSFFAFGQKVSVQGTVYYHNDTNYPMAGITMYLKDMNGNLLDVATSNPNGMYNFGNVTPGNYIVSASTTQSPLGVGIEDAQMVLLYLNNLIMFDNIQQLAADVTGDGVITMADYDTIMNHWLLTGMPFPVGDWVFTEDTITVTGGKDNPPTTGGSGTGDVGGIYLPGTKPKLMLDLLAEGTISVETKQDVDIPVRVNSHINIGAMGIVLEYPADLMQINGIHTSLSGLIYKIKGNKVIINYLGECMHPVEFMPGDVLFTIQAATMASFTEGKNIQLEIDPYVSQLNDKKGKIFIGESISAPGILWKSSVFAVQEIAVSENVVNVFPNPANGIINFSYQLPANGKVEILLSDVSGKVVWMYSQQQGNGTHSVSVNTDALQPGIYFYSIQSLDNRLNIKNKLLITR